jgi:hypothetical protein
MKKLLFLLAAMVSIGMISCRVQKGCPSSGKNVGAERVLTADAKTMKAMKKAPKFKS